MHFVGYSSGSPDRWVELHEPDDWTERVTRKTGETDPCLERGAFRNRRLRKAEFTAGGVDTEELPADDGVQTTFEDYFLSREVVDVTATLAVLISSGLGRLA